MFHFILKLLFRYVVVFTIERFIIVYFPLNRQQICTKRRNMTALIALFIFSLIFYSFSLFTSGLEDPKATQEPTCITLEKWFHVVKVFIVIDTCFTLFIPMTIIFVMNLSIIIKLMKADTTIESQNTRNSRISVQLDHAKASKLYQSKKKCSLLRSMLNCKQKKSHEFTYSSPLMDTENTIFELSGDKNTKRSTIKSLAPSLDAESIHGFGRNTKEHVKHKVSFKDKKTSELNTKESTCKVNMDYRMSLAYATKCNQNRKNSTVSLSFDKGMAFNRKTSYSRTTKMLLVISTCFLILNTPIALCKLWYFLKSLSFISNSNNSEIYYPTENIDHLSNQTNLTFYEAASNLKTFEANPTEEFVERITCYIYYLNFSLNFLLYSAYGSRFRAKLLKSFAFLNRFISKK